MYHKRQFFLFQNILDFNIGGNQVVIRVSVYVYLVVFVCEVVLQPKQLDKNRCYLFLRNECIRLLGSTGTYNREEDRKSKFMLLYRM